MNLDGDDLSAIGNNDITVLAEIMDKPLPKDPGTKKLTVESLPFQVYPLGPVQTPLSDDPLMTQFELKAAKLRASVKNAAGPNDRSEAAENLIYCYLDMGKMAEAQVAVPDVTDPASKCDVEFAIVYRDPALTNIQKIEKFSALEKEYRQYPDRVRMIDHYIGYMKYQMEHADSFE